MSKVRQRKNPVSDISDEEIIIPKASLESSYLKDTCVVLSALVILLLGMSFVITQTFTFGVPLPNIKKFIPVKQ